MHSKESPLSQTLNPCQAQPAPHFIAPLLSASAVLPWGSTARREETFPQDGLIRPEHSSSKSPTPGNRLSSFTQKGARQRGSHRVPQTRSSQHTSPFDLHQYLCFHTADKLLSSLSIHPSLCPHPPAAEPSVIGAVTPVFAPGRDNPSLWAQTFLQE